jgi:hypothetical protein
MPYRTLNQSIVLFTGTNARWHPGFFYRGISLPTIHYFFLASRFGVGYPFVLAVILPVA